MVSALFVNNKRHNKNDRNQREESCGSILQAEKEPLIHASAFGPSAPISKTTVSVNQRFPFSREGTPKQTEPLPQFAIV